MDISTSRKMLIKLAFPLLLENILKNLMNTVNVFMLASYSDNASAAVGVANQLFNVANIAFTSVATGTIIIVNQLLGAGRNREAAKTSMNALSFSTMLGLVFTLVIFLLSEPILLAMGLETELLAPAKTYMNGLGTISVFISASLVMSALFRSHNDTKTPMIAVVVTNIINALGAWIVIFRPFEQPFEGVEGIVIVRMISELVGFIFLTVATIRTKYDYRLKDLIKLDLRGIFETIKLALMVGSEGLSYTMGQVITTSFITALGAVALSAKVYVQTISVYTYLFGIAIGQAMQIIVGHLIGAGRSDDCYRFVNKYSRWVIGCNIFFATLLYLIRKPVIGLFTDNQEIISLAGTLLFIDIFINTARALNHSYKLGLTGSGYTFVPMLVAIGAIWILDVGIGWLTTSVFSLGIIGLWIGQLADEACRGVFAVGLWKKRRWEKAAVIKKA